MHCGDQRHLGLCLGYVPALAYGSCRVSDQGTTLRASDLHNARATILNPFSLHVCIDVYIYIYILHENPIDRCSPALVVVWNQNYMNLINQSNVIVLIVINPIVIVLFTKFVLITRDCPIVSA